MVMDGPILGKRSDGYLVVETEKGRWRGRLLGDISINGSGGRVSIKSVSYNLEAHSGPSGHRCSAELPSLELGPQQTKLPSLNNCQLLFIVPVEAYCAGVVVRVDLGD